MAANVKPNPSRIIHTWRLANRHSRNRDTVRAAGADGRLFFGLRDFCFLRFGGRVLSQARVPLHQLPDFGSPAGRVPPAGQPPRRSEQFQRPDATAFLVAERDLLAQRPRSPAAARTATRVRDRFDGQQTLVGHDHQAGPEPQGIIQVRSEERQHFFAGLKLSLARGAQITGIELRRVPLFFQSRNSFRA